MSAAAHLDRFLVPAPARDGSGGAGEPGGPGAGLAVVAAVAGGALVELSLFASAAAARAAWPGCREPGPDAPPPLPGLQRQLAEYFAGERRVWRALVAIPYGETRSYAEIARTIGHPAACRAVGRANGSNPIALVIPCHRVIGSDGSLTGYGGGLPIKRFLLDLESGDGASGAAGAAQRQLPLAH